MVDNLLAPDPVHLPEGGPDARARAALDAGEDPRSVAAAEPASPYAWAALSSASSADDPVAAYAFARTGYHRGLDALRKGGWRGQGPVPASHGPNHGVILAVLALRDAAGTIGEAREVARLAALADDFDPEAESLLS